MKTFSTSIQSGVRLLIFLNLLMAAACIWAFLRIAPSLEEANRHNDRSLKACENMLLVLAARETRSPEKLIPPFEKILRGAEGNITEKGEREALKKIETSFRTALRGDPAAVEQILRSIYDLAEVNRKAMSSAAHRVKALGTAGAWGVVFMAVLLFLCGLLLLTRLRKGFFRPLTEIRETLRARKNGDLFRRCHLPADTASDIRETGNDLNSILDACSARNADTEDRH